MGHSVREDTWNHIRDSNPGSAGHETAIDLNWPDKSKPDDIKFKRIFKLVHLVIVYLNNDGNNCDTKQILAKHIYVCSNRMIVIGSSILFGY